MSTPVSRFVTQKELMFYSNILHVNKSRILTCTPDPVRAMCCRYTLYVPGAVCGGIYANL